MRRISYPFIIIATLLLSGISHLQAQVALSGNIPANPAASSDHTYNQAVVSMASRDYLVRNWSVSNGLPVNFITDIIQTRDGYIWVTTYDGLARFDGIRFQIFNSSTHVAIPNNRFRYIMEDQNANLWVSNDNGGVLRYSNGEMSFFKQNEGFTDGYITQKPIDTGSGIVFPTSNGLFIYQDGVFSHLVRRNSPQANWYTKAIWYNGLIYASTHDGVVVTDLEGNFVVFKANPGHSNEFTSLAVLNNILLAYNGETFLELNAQKELAPQRSFPQMARSYIHHLYSDDEHIIIISKNTVLVSDRNGRYRSFSLPLNDEDFGYYVQKLPGEKLGVGTIRGLYFEIDGDKITRFNPSGAFDNVIVESTYTDRDGQLWVRTNNGLYNVDESIVHTFGSREGLLQDNMLALFEDSRNNFWVGMRMSGINLITPSGTIHRHERLIASTFDFSPFIDTYAFFEVRPGVVWAAIDRYGIAEFRNERLHRVISLGQPSQLNSIRAFVRDPNGTIWAGTFAGLVQLSEEGQIVAHYTTKNGLASDRIQILQPDASSNLWLGTAGGGVSYFSGNTFTNFTTRDGLPSNNIRAIYLDRDDTETLWFGTEGRGLVRFKNGVFQTINQTMGLFDDHIHTITEDRHQRLWMSTNRGVFHIRKQDANDLLAGRIPQVYPSIFNTADGMRSEEANGGFQNSALLRPDGYLFYPTQLGISIFETWPVEPKQLKPVPFIEAIIGGGRTWSGTDNVVLRPGQNDFRVEFTGFEYQNPERINFRYKLAGYDRDWQYSGMSRIANYTNLPPGNYTFQVSIRNADLSWSEDVAETSIRIQAHYYEQLWFLLLMVVLLGSAIYSGFEWKLSRVQQRERELEQKISARTADLLAEKEDAMQKQIIIEKQAEELKLANSAKDKFLAMIAHDLRSPFGGILGLLEYMNEEYSTMSEDDRISMLKSTHLSSVQVYNLLEDLLSWAELQKDNIRPGSLILDAETVIYEVLETMQTLASNKRIRLETHFQGNVTLHADPKMLQSILRNLLSNAIKFSFPNKVVTIRAWETPDFGCIAVSDTGIGMSEEQIRTLFLPDKSTSKKGTSNEMGSGLGLLICHELARIQHIRIDVFSDLGKGSVFTLQIPRVQAENSPQLYNRSAASTQL